MEAHAVDQQISSLVICLGAEGDPHRVELSVTQRWPDIATEDGRVAGTPDPEPGDVEVPCREARRLFVDVPGDRSHAAASRLSACALSSSSVTLAPARGRKTTRRDPGFDPPISCLGYEPPATSTICPGFATA